MFLSEDSGQTWSQSQKLLSSDGASNDNFGSGLSLSGNILVVGANLDDDKGIDSGAKQ